MNLNDKKNIVKLTYREHYIVHLLLVKIFEKNKNCYEKMLYAANFLTNRISNNREYAWVKNEFSKLMSEKLKGNPSRAKGKKWSEESKKQKSGKNHYMFEKTYEEIFGEEKAKKLKENRAISQTGRKKSKKEKQKLSSRIITDDWKNKISEANKGKIRSENHKQKISDFFSNPDLNPHVDQTLYKFHHKDGRTIICRKYDMKKNYNCSSIHKIINGTRNICQGWSYKGEIIKKKKEK